MRLIFSCVLLCSMLFTSAQTAPVGEYQKHKVKPGETLYNIAVVQYKISVEELRRINPQIGKDNILSEGQELNVPHSNTKNVAPPQNQMQEKPTPVATPKPLTTTNTGTVMHTVKAGETIYGIAVRQYGITPEELLKANPSIQTKTGIAPGQQLRIPVKSTQPEAPVAKVETEPAKPSAMPVSQAPATTAVPTPQKKETAAPPAEENKPVPVREPVPSETANTAEQKKETEVVVESSKPTVSSPSVKTNSIRVEKNLETMQVDSQKSSETFFHEETTKRTDSTTTVRTTSETRTSVIEVEKTEVVTEKEIKKVSTASIYDPHINGTEARNFPSRLGEGFENGAFNLIDLHAWVSNTSISYASIRDMIFGDKLTDVQAANIISQMKTRNNFFVNVDYQSLNVGFKVRRKKKELFSMELGHRERVTANLQYNKNLFKFVLQGNKQFAGQKVALGTVRGNALYVREFPVGVSVPVNIVSAKHAVQLRPALRAKFLMGIGNVYTKQGDASMYTDPEGKYIDFDFNYLVNYSIPNSLRGLSGAGNLGWGTDFGLGINLDQNLSFDIGLIDVGAVRFKNNVRNYSRTGTYRYEGAEAQLFTDDEGEKGIGFSLNEEVFNPVKSENPYTTPLGAKITFRAEYRFGLSRWGIKRDSSRRHFQHHVYLNYIQGLQNAYSATTTPAFSIGYMYSLKNVLNLGLNMGFLGYNKFSIGPYLSVKAGVFVIGFGSDNLMPFVAPKAGTGVDAYFNIGFVF